jgi:endonuclease IV
VKWSRAATGGGNELAHLTWDAREPDLDDLMALIKRQRMGFTLISESPNLETDALRMKKALGL